MTTVTTFPVETTELRSALARWPAALALAGAVATCLLWTMQYLITTHETVLATPRTIDVVSFVRKPTPPPAPPPKEHVTKPPLPMPQPARPVLPGDSIGSVGPNFSVSAPEAGPRSPPALTLGAIGEGNYLPLVKVAPIYPARAIPRGIEGYCVVSYTVTKSGTISNPTVVADQCSSSLFHKASVRAASQFKYRPRVVNGAAVAVANVRNRFTFRLE